MQPYMAVFLNPEDVTATSLRVDEADGAVSIFPYRFLVNVHAPSNKRLTLIFRRRSLLLTGTHLQQLVAHFQTQRIRQLFYHVPDFHPPALPGQTIIKSIENKETFGIREGFDPVD